MKSILTILLLSTALASNAQVANPDVNQQNLSSTVCVPGWSASVRPPTSYTAPIKVRLFAARSMMRKTKDTITLGRTPNITDYELDHWWPIANGGSPTDPHNLKLQLWNGSSGARAKDTVEVAVHRRLCSGQMTLAQAGACFSTANSWKACK